MTIKILCLNLFEGGLFWENIKAFFQRERPDILCLQEVVDGDENQPLSFQSIKRLKALLPNFHYYYSPEMHETWPHGSGDAGNAIFSKFPIVAENTVFLHHQYEKIIRPADEKDFSHYPKNLQHVIVDVEGKKLHVCNLHGIWELSGGDTPERLKMSEIILAEIGDHTPLVLMGDFNLRPNTQTIASIEAKLTNVFKDKLESSFNMRHKTNPGYATAVVDMFFASSDVKIEKAECPDDDVSDHKPLVVNLSI
jgi:endonuclease/exonuclease/phosphatase family metal-dependent hydrolase